MKLTVSLLQGSHSFCYMSSWLSVSPHAYDDAICLVIGDGLPLPFNHWCKTLKLALDVFKVHLLWGFFFTLSWLMKVKLKS